jgi:hypothetical protein
MVSSQETPTPPWSVAKTSRRWARLCAALAAALMFLWPEVWGADFVWGDPLGESDNHLWMFWSVAQSGATANSPTGIAIPLMDPINYPAYALGEAIGGPLLGWRLIMALNIGLAMLGGFGLAREVGGPRAGWVGMVATAFAPSLAGFLNFGMTESWTLGWFAIHAWMLIAYARRGGAVRACTAGLALGAVAMSGWYHALYGLILEAMLVPVLFWRFRRPGLIAQGLLGLAIAWPLWMKFQEVRELWEGRWRMPPPGPPGPRDDWAELPVFGTDILNLVRPSVASLQPAKCAYLGLVLLGLIAWGLLRERRRTAVMLGLAAPFLLLALGPWPTLGGKALGFAGPAYGLVQIAPSLSGMSHWERAVGAAVPFLAAAAAIGAARLPRRAWVIPLTCGLIMLDSLLFSSAPWPRTSYRVQMPEALDRVPGSGGLIQLPFDNGRAEFSDDPARIYTRWQLEHGRSISENYEGVDSVLQSSELMARADMLCGVRQTIPPYYQVPSNLRPDGAPEGAALERERVELRSWGYSWIVLHRERCPRDVPVIQLLDERLGEGLRLEPGLIAWEL